jgi:hypothetical protein
MSTVCSGFPHPLLSQYMSVVSADSSYASEAARPAESVQALTILKVLILNRRVNAKQLAVHFSPSVILPGTVSEVNTLSTMVRLV